MSKENKNSAKKEPAMKTTDSSKNGDFVIINIKNSQEKVSIGDTLEVSKLSLKKGDKIKFKEVLLSHEKGVTRIGKPYLGDAEVTAEVLEHTKGDKVHTRKFKAKSRYRKHTGHRAKLSKIKINNIKF